MKNVLIGLLVIAAGTGIYFFVIKKKAEKPIDKGFNKELIIWEKITIKEKFS